MSDTAPALVITTASRPPRKIGGGLDGPPVRRPPIPTSAAPVDHERELWELRARVVDAETAAKRATKAESDLRARLRDTEAKLAQALTQDRTEAEAVAKLAAVRKALVAALPLHTVPPADDLALAALIGAMARSASVTPRGDRPWDPTPIERPDIACPEPTDDERWWADGRPTHLAPFWCRWCARPFYVRRHLEEHEHRAAQWAGMLADYQLQQVA